MLAVFFLVMAGLNHQPMATLTDRFDLVEVNHFHDEFGFPVFDQLIFRNWHRSTHGFRVEAWVMLRNGRVFTAQGQAAFDKELDEVASRLSLLDAMDLRRSARYRGDYEGGRSHPQRFGTRYITWFHQDGWTREIHTASMIETWTQYDPERIDRRHLAESERKGFRAVGEGVMKAPAMEP